MNLVNVFVNVIILFCCLSANGFTPSEFVPNVVDDAGVLSKQDILDINAVILNLRTQSDVYAAVYIVNTLGGSPIEDVANKTFNKWELGESSKDNGLLFIFAIQDRNARIEVGSGLEGEITDAHSKRLLDLTILPFFKKADYRSGIIAGLERVNLIINKGSVFENEESAEEEFSNTEGTTDSAFNFDRAALAYGYWIFFLILIWPYYKSIQYLAPAPYKGQKIVFINGVPAWSKINLRKSWKSMSLKEIVLLTLFLAVNPGCFVLIFFGFESLFEDISRFFKIFDAPVDWDFSLIFILIYSLHSISFLLAISIGRFLKNPNPECYRPLISLLIYVLALNRIFAMLGLIFTSVCLYLALLFLQENIVVASTIFFILFVLFFHLNITNLLPSLISASSYNKDLVYIRWNRILNRVSSTRQIFGKTYDTNYISSSRSSRSSGSSSSRSSSSGGRSSGGGASSRW